MSQPKLSGEQLAVQVTDGLLRVTSDPGFTSDNGDGCPYRAVVIYGAFGDVIYGREPAQRTKPDERWEGFFETRDLLAAARIPVQIAGKIRVYGGSLFKGWGDAPGDWLEWGADDLGQNPSGVPRVNEVTFTVAAPPEPPLPVNSARLALEQFAKSSLGKNAFKTWEAANPAEARNLANGDLAANHYATRFGKFLVYLRQAAAQ